MTITGTVEEPIRMHLWDFDSKTETAGEANTPFVIAKTESADKFMLAGCSLWNDESQKYEFAEDIKGYKDGSDYVYNGDVSKMEVCVREVDDNYNILSETYAKTYADAINIINNCGNADAYYELELRNTGEDGNQGVIKTALSKGNPTYGALALPKANKVKRLGICSEDPGNPVIVKYTGTMAPKCDLALADLILTEGKINNKEADGFEEYNYITPDAGSVTLTFDENVTTPGANDKVTDDYFKSTSDGETIVYEMVCKSISGSKGNVVLSASNEVYTMDKIDIYGLQADSDAVVAGNGTIKVKELSLASDYPSRIMRIKGKKAITFTDIEISNLAGQIEVDTCFTAKGWKKAASQLTVNGAIRAIGDHSELRINPYIYSADTRDYQLLDDAQLEEMLITSAVAPTAWQKIMTASVAATPACTLLGNQDVTAVKYKGGVYFTGEEQNIAVIANNDGYSADFFTWEEAVSEIDRMNHKDWTYTILLKDDIGADTPIKNLTIPSKAGKVTVYGMDAGDGSTKDIRMTGTTISAKTNVEFRNVSIAAVKKTGNNYYAVPYTMNTGNYEIYVFGMESWVSMEDAGDYDNIMNVSGTAKGSFICNPKGDVNYIHKISGVGGVILSTYSIPETTEPASVYYSVPEGITGVSYVNLMQNVSVDCGKKEFSAKNLCTYGGSSLTAKNITVSDTLWLGGAYLKAGTTASGDGKVTLNKVILRSNDNTIEGKQDAKGNSLINIKGTVTNGIGDNIQNDAPAITIGLYYHNSAKNYVQLTDGLTLLTAPKAASSWFAPNYSWTDDNGTPDDESDDTYYGNMGDEILEDCSLPGAPGVNKVSTYNLYKSGNVIKYGRTKEASDASYWGTDLMEARLWIGTNEPYQNAPYIDFATYEEAVKAIDSMSLYQTDEYGNATKTYENYCIQLYQDVEIGNEKGDNKYSALLLPAKTSDFTLFGNGHSVTFSGNVALKCNTKFENVGLNSVKAVKGEAVPVTMNFTVGNYTMTWQQAWTNGSEIGSISGSSKSGRLVVRGSWTYLEANSVKGLQKLVLCDASEANVIIHGDVNVGAIRYENPNGGEHNGTLEVMGNLTADAIYLIGGGEAWLHTHPGKTFKLNGVTVTESDGRKHYETVIAVGAVDADGNPCATPVMMWTDYDTTGTRLITGKYLDADDWYVRGGIGEEENYRDVEYTTYVSGDGLYLGSRTIQETP